MSFHVQKKYIKFGWIQTAVFCLADWCSTTRLPRFLMKWLYFQSAIYPDVNILLWQNLWVELYHLWKIIFSFLLGITSWTHIFCVCEQEFFCVQNIGCFFYSSCLSAPAFYTTLSTFFLHQGFRSQQIAYHSFTWYEKHNIILSSCSKTISTGKTPISVPLRHNGDVVLGPHFQDHRHIN